MLPSYLHKLQLGLKVSSLCKWCFQSLTKRYITVHWTPLRFQCFPVPCFLILVLKAQKIMATRSKVDTIHHFNQCYLPERAIFREIYPPYRKKYKCVKKGMSTIYLQIVIRGLPAFIAHNYPSDYAPS